jgi:DoxX-like family
MRAVTIFAMQATFAVIVAGSGAAMILGSDVAVRAFAHLGLGPTPRMLIGTVETMAGLCLLLPRSALLGAAVLIALCLSMSGAIIADAAHGSSLGSAAPVSPPRIAHALARSCDGSLTPPNRFVPPGQDI